jgi:hypothetical protein
MQFFARGRGLLAVLAILVAGGLAAAPGALAAPQGGAPAVTGVNFPVGTTATIPSGHTGGLTGAPEPQVEVCFDLGTSNGGTGGTVFSGFNTTTPGQSSSGAFTDPTDYTLSGFREDDALNPQTVTPETGKPNCLILHFANGNPSDYVQGFTMLQIRGGAVQNSQGRNNTVQALQIDQSDASKFVTAGGNAGPVLTHISNIDVNATDPSDASVTNSITYDFDKVIDCAYMGAPGTPAAVATAGEFGYYVPSDATAPGTEGFDILQCQPSSSSNNNLGEVTIGFHNGGNGQTVDQANRFDVEDGATRTLDMAHSLNATNVIYGHGTAAVRAPIGGPSPSGGNSTTNPYLVSVTSNGNIPSGSDSFNLTYNQPIVVGGAGGGNGVVTGNICVYLSEGDEGQYCATGAQISSGQPNVMTVSFNQLHRALTKAVTLTDEGGAVTQGGTGTAASEQAEIPIQAVNYIQTGYSDSLVLSGCTLNSAQNAATFYLSGSGLTDGTLGGGIDPAGFGIVDTNGNIYHGTAVNGSTSTATGNSNNQVQIGFPNNAVQNAKACLVSGDNDNGQPSSGGQPSLYDTGSGTLVNGGAVTDIEGEANDEGLSGIGIGALKGPGSGPSGTGGGTGGGGNGGGAGGGGTGGGGGGGGTNTVTTTTTTTTSTSTNTNTTNNLLVTRVNVNGAHDTLGHHQGSTHTSVNELATFPIPSSVFSQPLVSGAQFRSATAHISAVTAAQVCATLHISFTSKDVFKGRPRTVSHKLLLSHASGNSCVARYKVSISNKRLRHGSTVKVTARELGNAYLLPRTAPTKTFRYR